MHSLSARLLVLTVLFVMLAEVLIFVPSFARFRHDYLTDRTASAYLAILALDATPDGVVSDALKRQLLENAGALAISARRGDMRLTLAADALPTVGASFDLRDASPLALIADAFSLLTADRDRVVRVVEAMEGPINAEIEVVIEERPLVNALVDFGGRIFILSLVISVITAGLVFLALQWLLVRPMQRITESMVSFRANPEDAGGVIAPSLRGDEIGVAERELARMQNGLRQALQQKEHLAALGTAVAKINHDLKGILSRAILVVDNLAASEDPEVKRIAPTLISSIDRAIAMCGQTLNYVGADQPTVTWARFSLSDLIGELRQETPDSVALQSDIPDGLTIQADRDQIYRTLSNLIQNAVEAGADRIDLVSRHTQDALMLEVADNGPGLPPRALKNLFKPFKGSAKAGGTGLGLAIAREMMRGHGGDLSLKQTGADGSRFCITLPDRADV